MEPTNVIQFPQLNLPAPDFNALTTDGMKLLDDYKDKWLVLFNEGKGSFAMQSNPSFISGIEKALKAKGLDKDSLIVTMCHFGSARGRPSADYLISQGFSNVKYIDQGFQGSSVKEGKMKGFQIVNGWQNAGLPWSSMISANKISKP